MTTLVNDHPPCTTRFHVLDSVFNMYVVSDKQPSLKHDQRLGQT